MTEKEKVESELKDRLQIQLERSERLSEQLSTAEKISLTSHYKLMESEAEHKESYSQVSGFKIIKIIFKMK